MNAKGENIQLAEGFQLLAVYFHEPEIEMWEQEDIHSRFASVINNTASAAFPAANRMREALVNINEEQMKVDYAALFVGPFELHAAPYGSVYLEKMKRLMGDSTMVVLDMYREAGLKVDVKEAPDHIAIELEFMHYLYYLEEEAALNGDNEKERNIARLRVRFLTTCLAPWIDQFCQSIKKGTTNLFYINLAECLENFINNVSEFESKSMTEHSLA